MKPLKLILGLQVFISLKFEGKTLQINLQFGFF